MGAQYRSKKFNDKLEAAKARAKQNPNLFPALPQRSSVVVLCEGVAVRSKQFLWTTAWRRLRLQALRIGPGHCERCRRSPERHGIRLNVDHIQPRSYRPDLALNPDNLQILCGDCNKTKGNLLSRDYRYDYR